MAEMKEPASGRLGAFWTALLTGTFVVGAMFLYDRLIVAKRISALKTDVTKLESSMEKIGLAGGREVVAVDLHAYLEKQQELLKKGLITETQFNANLSEYILKVKGMPKDRIVLSSDAVLTNVPIMEP
ncbi:MAG: hypothetical protein HZA04_02865 [Nitrospinae bacterium]|nr:hypothetical protein [Nitrospinota bacterium]